MVFFSGFHEVYSFNNFNLHLLKTLKYKYVHAWYPILKTKQKMEIPCESCNREIISLLPYICDGIIISI